MFGRFDLLRNVGNDDFSGGKREFTTATTTITMDILLPLAPKLGFGLDRLGYVVMGTTA